MRTGFAYQDLTSHGVEFFKAVEAGKVSSTTDASGLLIFEGVLIVQNQVTDPVP